MNCEICNTTICKNAYLPYQYYHADGDENHDHSPAVPMPYDYNVICDESNNSEADRAENRLNASVYLNVPASVKEGRGFHKMLVEQEIDMYWLMHRTQSEYVTQSDFNTICDRRGFNSDERAELERGIEQIKTDGWRI